MSDHEQAGHASALRKQALEYVTEEQYALLARHGYDPDALACGTVYRLPTRTWPLTLLDGHVPGTMLRSHVCELDGVLIDEHEGSDLDPGSTSCIHCDYEGPNP